MDGLNVTGHKGAADSEAAQIGLAIGLLTLPQVAAQLAFGFPANSDGVLLVKRLIARGSLSAMNTAGRVCVDLETLRKFVHGLGDMAQIRAGLKLPKETLSPIFPIQGNGFDSAWNYECSLFERSILAELNRQLPESLGDLTGRLTMRQGKDEVAAAYAQRNPEIDLVAEYTPEIKAICSRPVPASSQAFQMPDASAFMGIAEIYLAMRLQGFVGIELQRLAYADPSNIKAEGLSALYASQETYTAVANAALAMLVRGSLRVSKYLSQSDTLAPRDPTKPAPFAQPVKVTVSIQLAEIIRAIGTNPTRLACLAL